MRCDAQHRRHVELVVHAGVVLLALQHRQRLAESVRSPGHAGASAAARATARPMSTLAVDVTSSGVPVSRCANVSTASAARCRRAVRDSPLVRRDESGAAPSQQCRYCSHVRGCAGAGAWQCTGPLTASPATDCIARQHHNRGRGAHH
jgi:hypothetical protein